MGEKLTTIPTIGFNVETVEYRNISFTIWDVGGQDKIRRLWRHYYRGSQVLIYVVDSNDQERFELAASELHKLLSQDELQDVVLLVLANKQDLPNAASASKIGDELGLHRLKRNEWFIQPCSAMTGDGIYEGLDWLADALARRRKSVQ